MRKIESLQENEVIEIKTKKQANKLKKLVDVKFNFNVVFPVFISKENNGYWWSGEPNGRTKLPASDFIKKSKTKQRLKALEARMDRIEELKGEYKVSMEFTPKLEVLPEKWCVELTANNEPYLSKWRGDDGLKQGEQDGYLHSNKIWYSSVRNEYTLISFDDFKRIVLDQPKEIDFSVAGQLLQDRHCNLVVTTGLHDGFTFSGTLLDGINTEHSAEWIKNKFTKSNTSITINPQP